MPQDTRETLDYASLPPDRSIRWMTLGYWIGITATLLFSLLLLAWMISPDPLLGHIARWLKQAAAIPAIVGAIGGSFTLFGMTTFKGGGVYPIAWPALMFNAYAVFAPLAMAAFN